MSWVTKLRARISRGRKDRAKRRKKALVGQETWYQQVGNRRRNAKTRNRKRRKLSRTQMQRTRRMG